MWARYDQELCGQCQKWVTEHPDVPLEDSPGRAAVLRQERHTDTDWKDEAACRDADAARFDAPADGHITNYIFRRYRETVREFCASCPVRRECGEEATEMEYEGLFGGDLRIFDHEGVPRIVRFTHRGGGGIRWVELARASR